MSYNRKELNNRTRAGLAGLAAEWGESPREKVTVMPARTG